MNYPQTSDIEYAEELTRRYGNSVTDEQFADFVKTEREPLITEAENYIQTMPIFANAGIYSYADFEAVWEKNSQTQEESDAKWTLLGEKCERLGFKLRTLQHFEVNFDRTPQYIDADSPSIWDTFNEHERERLREIVQNNEHHAILTYWIYKITQDYTAYFSILLMLSVLMLVSPLVTSDHHDGLHYLQYSSKTGRKIMYSQLTAVLLSAFVLATLMILIFGGIYSQNGTALFWNASVNSAFNPGMYSVFPLTYGQWLTAMTILMYALALGAAALTFILSRYSRNLITLIMKLIPVFTALLFLCIVVFNGLFEMGNLLYKVKHIAGTEAYVCGIVGILGLAAALFVAKREKRVDVV